VAIGLLCIYRSDLFLKSHNICLVAVISGFVLSNILTGLIDFVAVNHNTISVGRDGHRVCLDARRIGRYVMSIITDQRCVG